MKLRFFLLFCKNAVWICTIVPVPTSTYCISVFSIYLSFIPRIDRQYHFMRIWYLTTLVVSLEFGQDYVWCLRVCVPLETSDLASAFEWEIVFIDLDFVSVNKIAKKNLVIIQPSWPHASSITRMYEYKHFHLICLKPLFRRPPRNGQASYFSPERTLLGLREETAESA